MELPLWDGRAGPEPPTVWDLSFLSQFCLLMHTKQSSVLVRVNRQDNFDREQEFRKQWTACKMCIGEGQMPLPLCPAVMRTACGWFTLIYAHIALRDFALASWKTPS